MDPPNAQAGPDSEAVRASRIPMTEEYIALGLILAGAMYLFWTSKVRTDVVALLVMLALIFPWPHSDERMDRKGPRVCADS